MARATRPEGAPDRRVKDDPLIPQWEERRGRAPQPAQDALGATKPPPVDQDAKRVAATALVASWLRGRTFALTHPPLQDAVELTTRLTRAGFIIWYVGDCPKCAANPGLCDEHD
jgi:hypothetical protein